MRTTDYIKNIHVSLTEVSPLMRLMIESFIVGQIILKIALNKIVKHKKNVFKKSTCIYTIYD